MADYSIKAVGGKGVSLRVKAIPTEAGRWSRRVVRRVSRSGARQMKQLAPDSFKTNETWPESSAGKLDPFSKRSQRGYPKLKNRIGASTPVYRPGGAGGGGTWTAAFGVSKINVWDGNQNHDPALIVYHGVEGKIFPKKGKTLTFIHGRTRGQIWRHFVEGQEAQTDWVRLPRNYAKKSIRESIRNFDLRHNAR